MSVLIKSSNPQSRKPYIVRYWHDGRQSQKGFTTRREAVDFKTKTDHDLRAHIFIDPNAASESFGEAAARMIASKRTANTRDLYSGVLKVHLRDFAGRKLRDVANDRDGVRKAVANHPRGKIMLTVIRNTVHEAVRAGRLTSHRLAGLEANHVTGKRQLIIATPEQVSQMADAMGSAHWLAVHIMRATGMRVREALALRSTDFMLNGMVRVVRQRDPHENGTVPLKHRQDYSGRDVPVAPYLAAMVREHVSAHGDGDLFTVTYRTFLARFTRAARAAGLPAGYTPTNCATGLPQPCSPTGSL